MADLQTPAEAAPINGGASSENLGPYVGSKRQRRPSVRLGDIGEQSAAAISYEAYVRRTKQWKISGHGGVDDSKYKHHGLTKDTQTVISSGKASKTRPLTNLGNGDCHEALENEDKNNNSGDGNLDSAGLGRRAVKDSKFKKGGIVKRARSNWGVSKPEEGTDGGDEKFSGDDGGGGGGDDVGFRDFDMEASESPLKDHSPIHSLENAGIDLAQNEGMFNCQRRIVRARVSESRDPEGVDLDAPSDTDGWKCGTSGERNGFGDRRCRSLEDSVRMWLNGLGLGRYAQVFEIHEVDEDVLPLLTLEDLKDMGINAVGSRRKMYCAIQKLGKGFT